MKKICEPLVGVLIATLIASSSAYAYGDFNARMDCVGKVSGWGSGYSNPRDILVEKKGHNSYVVSGKVEDRHDRDHRFNCRIEHKEVVSWNVSSGHDDKDKSDKKALAIGAGIVGLAAIAAIAASNSNDGEHEQSRSLYNTGRGNPFDDIKYLQNECRRVVRQHLAEDHGRVDDLDFKTADLDGRTLSGRGKVRFAYEGRHRIDYRCQFDRAGNIHDGHYEYRDDDDR